ncbi:hypothetical protein H0H93_002940 [Arthromyces matolae]|nr:hypothetical protein H0H93_002940 [Arthromyces matolae]
MDVKSSFSSFGVLQAPSTRLLPSACCPDKDLIVLISRLGGRDRLGLWNYSHSAKIWEVDTGAGDENTMTEIVGIAWSPDGKSLVAVHHPPLITIHSLQDGAMMYTLPMRSSSDASSFNFVDAWWFCDARSVKTSAIPDILSRNDVVPGTAHAILRTLPLLDSIQEDSQRSVAMDLFAFQGTQTKTSIRTHLGGIIDEWPTLPQDLMSASINSHQNIQSTEPLEALKGEVEESNVNSLLVVTDNSGFIHCYLDGTYPLGRIAIDSESSIKSLLKHRKHSLVTFRTAGRSTPVTSLYPVIVDVPILLRRHVRDMAKLSSTARELVWYCMRAVKELHVQWFGSETSNGARNLGSNWIEALEVKQREQFGGEPNAILDLTSLLVTGRASESLLDFLGSAEQMSERGIQKWESAMTDALAKMRDYSEQRITPACQRLHIILEEVQGWAQLPEYTLFDLPLADIQACLDLLSRMILLLALLASTARLELSRFKAFLHWLRFETSALNPSSDNVPQLRHDVLEVNNYFISGLASSPIDQWFTGSMRQLSLSEPSYDSSRSLSEVVEEAQSFAKNHNGLIEDDSAILDKASEFPNRNLNILVEELATRCKAIFSRAADVGSRSSTTHKASAVSMADLPSRPTLPDSLTPFSVRERTTVIDEGDLRQFLLVPLKTGHCDSLSLARLRYHKEALERPCEISILLLEPLVLMGSEPKGLDLLEAEFLDDQSIIVVCRVKDNDKLTNVAMIKYDDLVYQTMEVNQMSNLLGQEELLCEIVEQWKQGHLLKTQRVVERARALKGGLGAVSMALNRRVGRRVGCVLDSQGTLESFDMEAEEDGVDGD